MIVLCLFTLAPANRSGRVQRPERRRNRRADVPGHAAVVVRPGERALRRRGDRLEREAGGQRAQHAAHPRPGTTAVA